MKAGKPRGAGGQEEKQRRQATHTCGPGCQELPIQSPGAPWVGVGVAKGERLQATSTPSAGLRGEAAGWGAKPCRALECWAVAGSQASPPGWGEGSQHHLPACQRRQGLLGRDRSTPQAHPEKTGAFVRRQQEWRTFWKLTAGKWHRRMGWRGQGLNLGIASSDCAFGQSVRPLEPQSPHM